MSKEDQVKWAIEQMTKCLKDGFYGNLRFNFKNGILVNANKEESLKQKGDDI